MDVMAKAWRHTRTSWYFFVTWDMCVRDIKEESRFISSSPIWLHLQPPHFLLFRFFFFSISKKKNLFLILIFLRISPLYLLFSFFFLFLLLTLLDMLLALALIPSDGNDDDAYGLYIWNVIQIFGLTSE